MTTLPPTDADPELTAGELGAWRGMLRVHAALLRSLDAELDAAHDLPLTSYARLRMDNAGVTRFLVGPHRNVLVGFNDTCHLWRAGVPCVLYGPGGGSESATVPDEYTRISDMERVAQVLTLTALDVCNVPE